jgi:hypothetical protein
MDKFGPEDLRVGGAALVLAIALLFFPWFSISFGLVSVTVSGTEAPSGWAGVLAVILALALVGDLAVERLSPATQLPALGGGRTATRALLAVGAAFFVALKFALHIHFSLFGWGFYVAVIATVAMVVAALRANDGRLPLGNLRRG